MVSGHFRPHFIEEAKKVDSGCLKDLEEALCGEEISYYDSPVNRTPRFFKDLNRYDADHEFSGDIEEYIDEGAEQVYQIALAKSKTFMFEEGEVHGRVEYGPENVKRSSTLMDIMPANWYADNIRGVMSFVCRNGSIYDEV